MRPSSVLTLTLALLLGTSLGVSDAQQSTSPGRIDVPLRQWVALDMPGKGQGPTGPIKHLTAAINPDNGRIYMTGGDYVGSGIGQQSYRQETWSLSLAERWANRADRNAGWRLEYPYCGPPDQVQPKHPDFVGWTWDSRRKVFWLVPGVMEISPDAGNCPGETSARKSDPGFLLNHIMQFDPTRRQWRDVSAKAGIAAETWMSVYDAKTDTIIRFGHTGGAGALVSVYHIERDQWTDRPLPQNAGRKQIRITKEYLATDHDARVIYAIDGVAGRLHRYQMDTQRIEDLGPVPGGPHGRENYMYTAWDSTNRVLLWFREPAAYAYDPESKKWEDLPVTADLPGAKVGGRVIVYDPIQNVTLLFGGYTANPHMFLFRHGDGR